MRLTVPGHRPCYSYNFCSEISMELATRGSRAKRGSDYNLPIDPRPTLDAIAQAVAGVLEQAGLLTAIPAKPDPFGRGGAFRNDRWFATIPNYQHPGTSELAPKPGIIIQRKPRRKPAPKDPGAPLKPTRDWPQRTHWLSISICSGEDNCLYTPEDARDTYFHQGFHQGFYQGCNTFWQRHSRNLFQAFMDANPDVMFRKNYLTCVQQIQPEHRCVHHGDQTLKDRYPIAHADLCRLPDGRRFVIAQPYCDDDLCPICLRNIAGWQIEVPELRWITKGKQRSWHFPGTTNLMFLGAQDTLDSLNLDYAVPIDTRPLKCTKYSTGPWDKSQHLKDRIQEERMQKGK